MTLNNKYNYPVILSSGIIISMCIVHNFKSKSCTLHNVLHYLQSHSIQQTNIFYDNLNVSHVHNTGPTMGATQMLSTYTIELYQSSTYIQWTQHAPAEAVQ